MALDKNHHGGSDFTCGNDCVWHKSPARQTFVRFHLPDVLKLSSLPLVEESLFLCSRCKKTKKEKRQSRERTSPGQQPLLGVCSPTHETREAFLERSLGFWAEGARHSRR